MNSQYEALGVLAFGFSLDYNVLVKHSTFFSNGLLSGASLRLGFGDPANKIVFENSVVAGSPVTCLWEVDPPFHTILATNTLFQDASCAAAGSGNLTGDPKLSLLADNGGPTLTLLPLPGSPLIDQGDLALCLSQDQRGQIRPVDKLGRGPQCDIGSVEVQ